MAVRDKHPVALEIERNPIHNWCRSSEILEFTGFSRFSNSPNDRYLAFPMDVASDKVIHCKVKLVKDHLREFIDVAVCLIP